ncbi:MAG: hypothetical protein EOO25_20220 [Comamonadaceae bacterium]|nr:MAG: hypothetical protein EOO25_20220 [Comamonadaceae bacterium]
MLRAAAFEQRAQGAQCIGWRRLHVDEIVDAGTQGSQDGSRFGRHAGGEHRQVGPVAFEALVKRCGKDALVRREVDEHRGRRQRGDAFVQRGGVGCHRDQVALCQQHLRQPVDAGAVGGGKQIVGDICFWKDFDGSVHGVVVGVR